MGFAVQQGKVLSDLLPLQQLSVIVIATTGVGHGQHNWMSEDF